MASHRALQSLLGDTEVAAPLAFGRCRARAQRVIDHADPTRPRMAPQGPVLWVRRPNTVIVAGLIKPFHRGHIFAVMGRHDGDVGGCRNQRSSLWEARGYPRLSPVDETAAAFGSR